MKALSIQQPWAWLIVNGYKDVENRDWPTKVRGRILIHAGKKFDEEAYTTLLGRGGYSLPPRALLERGGIVGEATIIGCVEESESEWFMGYYGFVLGNAKPLPFRALRGQLGFFDVPEDPVATAPETDNG
jgi:hypothetical protein